MHYDRRQEINDWYCWEEEWDAETETETEGNIFNKRICRYLSPYSFRFQFFILWHIYYPRLFPVICRSRSAWKRINSFVIFLICNRIWDNIYHALKVFYKISIFHPNTESIVEISISKHSSHIFMFASRRSKNLTKR